MLYVLDKRKKIVSRESRLYVCVPWWCRFRSSQKRMYWIDDNRHIATNTYCWHGQSKTSLQNIGSHRWLAHWYWWLLSEITKNNIWPQTSKFWQCLSIKVKLGMSVGGVTGGGQGRKPSQAGLCSDFFPLYTHKPTSENTELLPWLVR